MEKDVESVSSISVVKEFPDVFPEELPSLPPDRKIEFAIDVLPGKKPTLHILRDCHVIEKIWNSFPWSPNIYSDDLLTWLEQNSKNHNKILYNNWSTLFLTTFTTIWKAKNRKILKNEHFHSELVSKLTKQRAIEYWFAHEHQKHTTLQSTINSYTPWQKLPNSLMKLNVDGSMRKSHLGAEGCIHNKNDH